LERCLQLGRAGDRRLRTHRRPASRSVASLPWRLRPCGCWTSSADDPGWARLGGHHHRPRHHRCHLHRGRPRRVRRGRRRRTRASFGAEEGDSPAPLSSREANLRALVACPGRPQAVPARDLCS
jgi:hypothetical protein